MFRSSDLPMSSPAISAPAVRRSRRAGGQRVHRTNCRRASMHRWTMSAAPVVQHCSHSSLSEHRCFSRTTERTDRPLGDAPSTSWLGGVVVSALGTRTRRPRFESRVAPLFHLDKLFTHIASPVSQLQETVAQKGVFGA